MRGQERGDHNELSGVVHGPSVQAAVVYGDVHVRTGDPAASQPRTPLPWQLPPPVPLTARTAEVERLEHHRASAARRGHPVLATVSGLGGVGKTALALSWLHRLRPDFPDGQLYADLGAQSPAGPADPAEVLSGFLRGLGVPPRQVPHGLAERAALYRSLTAERAVVVLLDDAASAAQVRPLLPGGSNVTLVTSRRRMSGLALEGCYQMQLEPLAPEAAMELLAATLADDRVATQADDARALVGLCAGLPLAVRVAGARLAARPGRRITTMVRALAAEQGRLDALAIDGDHGVRAALDLSYRGLPETAAQLYRLLGVHPGREFGSAVAAAVLGRGSAADGPGSAADGPGSGAVLPDVERSLENLYDANLLIDVGEDRYRFHDLVRLHATEKAAQDESEAGRAAAFRRIADHYLATATRAEKAVEPYHPLRERSYGPGPVVEGDPGPGPRAALDWLERELPQLMAVIRHARAAGAAAACWQLADAMGPLFIRRKHYDEWHAVYEEGLVAAHEVGDTQAACRMLTSGGQGELGRGRHERALEMFEEAARLFASVGDLLGHARTLNYRGLAHQRLGQLDEAAVLFDRAAVELPRHGDERAGGLARLNAADIELARGRPERAAEGAAAARAALVAVDDPYNAARATTLLGRSALLRGGLDEAERLLSGALADLGAVGADSETARALRALAEVAEGRGQRALARQRYHQALALAVAANQPRQADELRARLRLLGEDDGAD
ncbi:putative regulator protein [Streptomyces graminofaciens]|uniref:Regulator protein n=1 Tax=Streptomyces graminofaciens TaxID=68212 RepID=A0ABN5VKL1_9ACTN|nr:tetratricopeptide repeat protein [Streptomyces graminofaciens]BBC33884.1 putative regulator protein [Streptomyces graminofaciens]